jgi:hypothetical protein
MVSFKQQINNTTWINIASDVDYILQNLGPSKIYIKASATIPTNVDGALEMDPKDVIGNTLLSGNIWIRGILGDSTVSYAK